MDKLTIKTLDIAHNKLIDLFIHSIKAEYIQATDKCSLEQMDIKGQVTKYSNYIIYNKRETDIQSIFNNKKKNLNEKEKEFMKCLTYAGQLMAKSFHQYYYDFNTQRDLLLKELDTTNKKALKDNAKYFILNQITIE